MHLKVNSHSRLPLDGSGFAPHPAPAWGCYLGFYPGRGLPVLLRCDVEVLKGALIAVAWGCLFSLVLAFLVSAMMLYYSSESGLGASIASLFRGALGLSLIINLFVAPGVLRGRLGVLQPPQHGSAGRGAGARVDAGLLSPSRGRAGFLASGGTLALADLLERTPVASGSRRRGADAPLGAQGSFHLGMPRPRPGATGLWWRFWGCC